MALDKFVFGLLIFSLIIVSGIFIVSDVNTSYGEFGTDINLEQYDPEGNFDITDEINPANGSSRTMFDRVFDTGVDADTSENSLFTGAFSAIRTMRNFIEYIGTISNTIMSALGIPAFFSSFSIIAITLFITLTGIFLMLRFKG